jgi:hypothetical protein
VPDSILLSNVPYVEDVNSAMEELAEQKKMAISAQAAAFGSMPIPEDDEVE